ncbi:MAG: sulfate reduction electron transfer complex DsrMKJOP subunit DsrM [Chlorobiaceae bacterium]|nr:sulfate reduction electron transfer complex DsrMKJOP subunit DsrM [Chlorobiaceae bacterium]NTV59884.1 sulfate reduction electron transfer complex DsrMKJOP subunit DsrM [Chlorobiaceae bacterium]
MKKILMPVVMVAVLAIIPYVGVEFLKLDYLFGVVIPYTATALFIAGFLYRIADWLIRPVPFRIPTTAGQEKSLDWIKRNRFESPYHAWEAVARVLSEVLLFRSLFRNTRAELHKDASLAYASDKWLWLGGLAFHWSLLVIVLRHTRFFFVMVPGFADFLDHADSFFDVTLPAFYISDALALGAITFLTARRFFDAKVRMISLPTDYFPLFLIGGIVLAGILMRYVVRLNIMPVKDHMLQLMHFGFDPPGQIGTLFYVHLFLISVLLVYFPLSKLMHMGAIFLSPTRNLCNNSREKRHVNPWNSDIRFRTYSEYEDEFREKMKKAGLPVEKQ